MKTSLKAVGKYDREDYGGHNNNNNNDRSDVYD
jgi:hypothetical protein